MKLTSIAHFSRPFAAPFGVLLTLGLLGACGQNALPGTPITSTADSGAGSLRDLLAAAQSGDTLRFTTPGTLTLTSPLTIAQNVTIIADGVTVDTAGRQVVVAQDATVSLSGGIWKSSTPLPAALGVLALPAERGGLSPDAPLKPVALGILAVTPTTGGVMRNLGTLTLHHLTVTGGTANLGGGIYNSGALALKDGAKVTGNQATLNTAADDSGDGGGIYNTGTLTLAGGSVDGNTAVDEGGGIRNTKDAKLYIQAGTVDGNSCTLPVTKDDEGNISGCAGGGIFSTGETTVSGGSISNNTATYFGGGLVAMNLRDSAGKLIPRPLTVSGGTIAGNTASDPAEGVGGGLWTNATFSMTGGSVRGNTAVYGGGALTWGSVALTGGSLEGNTAKYGGGINAYRPVNNSNYAATTFTFGGTAVVKGNTSSEGGAGGGMYVRTIPLTMTGGTVDGNTAVGTGGGIVFAGGTVSTIQGGVISGNKVTGTDDGGGGVRIFSDSTLNLSGGEISGSTAVKSGGGVVVGGTLNMTGGSIQGNTVTSRTDGQGGGGGVRLYSGSRMTASGGSISNNTAWYGGGVETNGAYQTSPTSTFTLAGATISGNKADGNLGGGFWNDGALTLQSGSVTGNSARDGGGIFNTKASSYSKSGGTVSGNLPNDVVQGQ